MSASDPPSPAPSSSSLTLVQLPEPKHKHTLRDRRHLPPSFSLFIHNPTKTNANASGKEHLQPHVSNLPRRTRTRPLRSPQLMAVSPEEMSTITVPDDFDAAENEEGRAETQTEEDEEGEGELDHLLERTTISPSRMFAVERWVVNTATATSMTHSFLSPAAYEFPDIETMLTSPRTSNAGTTRSMINPHRFAPVDANLKSEEGEKIVPEVIPMSRTISSVSAMTSISETFAKMATPSQPPLPTSQSSTTTTTTVPQPKKTLGASTGPVHGALPRRVRKTKAKAVVAGGSDTE